MMREFLIELNGKTYEVRVHEKEEYSAASEFSVRAVAPQQPTQEKPQPPAEKPQAMPPDEKKTTMPAAKGEDVLAPMPGVVLKIAVTEGDIVAAGQVLIILEAMKMETEIVAPVAGRITKIGAVQGRQVDTDTLLCTIA